MVEVVDINKDDKQPLVSIITVVFNGEKYLEQTIQSVINQTYQNIEYIIIDGGSTDGTVDIIRKYEDKIAYWVSEPDKGIYDAMNKGITKANGELIGIINSDDWYELNAVELVVNQNVENPEVHVIHGMLRYWKSNEVYGIIGYTKSFLLQDMISHPTCFVKKEVYLKNGLFDCNYRIAADYEFMLRLFKNNAQFYFIESILANFRMEGVSVISNRINIERLKIYKKYKLVSKFKYYLILVYYNLRSLYA